MKKGTFKDTVGSGLRGYIDISYATLRSKLGEPYKKDDLRDNKVDAEWIFKHDDGTVISVYNYKDGKNYLGKRGRAVSSIRDWHIGGKGNVLKHMKELFPRSEVISSEQYNKKLMKRMDKKIMSYKEMKKRKLI